MLHGPSPAPLSDLPDERDLVARVRSGDDRAFEALFHRYYAGLYRVALGYVRRRDAAEDLVHDLFFRVWEQRRQWDVNEGAAVYLHRAIRNRALDYLRHELVEEGWRNRVHAGEAIFGGERESPERPDALLHLNELDREIVKAVARLPERCRQVFILNREQRLSYAEVAAVLGISVKTVDVHLGRALKALRKALAPYLDSREGNARK